MAQQIDENRCAWEFPVVTAITGADDLIAELRQEVAAILEAGHLAPLNCRYGDMMPSPVESHFVYQEPGRIITTLAWAYPHLDPTRQAEVRAYVAREMADDRFAPWGPHPMPRDVGARREWHPMEKVWGARENFGRQRPCVQTLYGLWLYAHRSGDWKPVESNWVKVREAYRLRAEQGNLYGTMGSHVAMARLADRFGDPAARTEALGNLRRQLQAGLNFEAFENHCRTNSHKEQYTKRNQSPLALYHGAMFLDLTPELGRYLRENLADTVLRRHREGVTRFPLWWLVQAPYFARWVGDESVGLSPEAIGMIAPVERWVVQADAATMRRYVRSVPTGRGDCHWIEMLVQVIEAHGSLHWTDVRHP